MIIKRLLKNEFLDYISKYYSNKIGKEVRLEIDLYLQYESVNPGLSIFYIDDNSKIYISDREIQEALEYYAKTNNYKLDSFDYISIVIKKGMLVSEDTPMFNGVVLNMKEKQYELIR